MNRSLLSAVLMLAAVTGLRAQHHSYRTQVPLNTAQQQVSLPVLPESLDFAGEAVPLDNYDTRESLTRELITTQFMHTRTMLSLLNMSRYFPVIEPILARNNIPEDFKYLCVAESGLNPNAQSTARAGGLWQLMPSVAKEYGLEVSDQIDERYNIEKSTEVACAYLRKAYERFGSWTMAAAAYNLGMAGLDRRRCKQMEDNYYDLFLPEETLRYMFRILSFKLLCNDPSAYGFDITTERGYHPLTDYTEVEIDDRNIDWPAFAKQHGTTYKMLREVNQWIRDYECDNKAGRCYKVKVPNREFRKKGV